MQRCRCIAFGVAFLLLVGHGVFLGLAVPPARTASGQAPDGPKQLAPWVMTVIEPDRDVADTFSGPRNFTEITREADELAWQPNFYPRSQTLLAMAQDVVFRRQIWNLQFAFKPVRMTYVELPQPDGLLKPTLVWYMVYRVTNTGYHLDPTPQEDQWGHELYDVERVNHSVRFFPQLVLESFDQKKAYVDRVIPLAVEHIRSIEDVRAPLLDSVQMTQVDIEISTEEEDHSAWGVATWEGVDPRTDFFSIFVQRLTNAYRWEVQDNGERVYTYKTLQLNFWRPGDALREHQDEIRFGFPAFEDVQGRNLDSPEDLTQLYRVSKPRDHLWVYRR